MKRVKKEEEDMARSKERSLGRDGNIVGNNKDSFGHEESGINDGCGELSIIGVHLQTWACCYNNLS